MYSFVEDVKLLELLGKNEIENPLLFVYVNEAGWWLERHVYITFGKRE